MWRSPLDLDGLTPETFWDHSPRVHKIDLEMHILTAIVQTLRPWSWNVLSAFQDVLVFALIHIHQAAIFVFLQKLTFFMPKFFLSFFSWNLYWNVVKTPKTGKNINYCLHVSILFSVKPCIYWENNMVTSNLCQKAAW